MLNITKLFGIEVIIHVAPAGEVNIKGIIQPLKRGNCVLATVVEIGVECKKDLKVGDTVMVFNHILKESPLLSRKEFDFGYDEPGEFYMLTEHLITMKVEVLDMEYVNDPTPELPPHPFDKK